MLKEKREHEFQQIYKNFKELMHEEKLDDVKGLCSSLKIIESLFEKEDAESALYFEGTDMTLVIRLFLLETII